MSEPTEAAYEAAALAYDEAVNAALRNPPGTVLGTDGRAALIANPAFRAAMNAVWPLAVAEGRRQAAVDVLAKGREFHPATLRAQLLEAAARIAEGVDG